MPHAQEILISLGSVQLMPTLRRDIVDAQNPGVYHCISRCVRRESLLSSSARRQWIVQRLEKLAEYLAIDVIAFAVMANHLHVLLRIRPDVVRSWSDREVAIRRIAILPNRRNRSRNGIALDAKPTENEIAAILSSPSLLERARRDLSDLGFFHRLLKEPCARMWNREDGVTGHFWEGRFLSPRVLDEAALLRVSRYIELNEIRARSADSIPTSVWTSARAQWKKMVAVLGDLLPDRSKALDALDTTAWEPVFPCRSNPSATSSDRCPHQRELHTPLVDYLLELDLHGRFRHPSKPGFISGVTRHFIDELHASLVELSDLAGSLCDEIREQLLRRLRRLTQSNVDHQRTGFLPIREHHHFGSCYGSNDAVHREALRRGVSRLIPIRIVE